MSLIFAAATTPLLADYSEKAYPAWRRCRIDGGLAAQAAQPSTAPEAHGSLLIARPDPVAGRVRTSQTLPGGAWCTASTRLPRDLHYDEGCRRQGEARA